MFIMAIMHIIAITSIISDCFLVGWLESIGSRVVYELDYKKPILYVIPIQSILGKLPLVPVGDTGTIPQSMRNAFSASESLPGNVAPTGPSPPRHPLGFGRQRRTTPVPRRRGQGNCGRPRRTFLAGTGYQSAQRPREPHILRSCSPPTRPTD